MVAGFAPYYLFALNNRNSELTSHNWRFTKTRTADTAVGVTSLLNNLCCWCGDREIESFCAFAATNDLGCAQLCF